MFDFLKDFFGSGNRTQHPPNDSDKREHFLRDDDESFSFFNRDHNDEHMGFNVFTNPLEMHRYFESQMNSMLKSFGIPGDGGFFGFGRDNGPDTFSNFLEGPEQYQDPPAQGDLRDQFLKPGYQKARIEERSDSDLDGKIKSADLDTIFSDKPQKIAPYVEKPRIQTFGRQVMTKMFTNHNGLIESHQTLRDSEGNEQTIVTHKRGDKEYTRITKINKNGEKEVQENFVNLDEGDLGKFLGGGGNAITDDPAMIPEKKHPNWFPFTKYFR